MLTSSRIFSMHIELGKFFPIFEKMTSFSVQKSIFSKEVVFKSLMPGQNY